MSEKTDNTFSFVNSALQKSLLCTDLTPDEISLIAEVLKRRKVPKDGTVFNEGDMGAEMFVLLSGDLSAFVSQSDGTERWMFNIKPGDFFGEMSIIASEPRSATILAKTASELAVLQAVDFYRLIFDQPCIGIKLLNAIATVQNIWFDQRSNHLNDLTRWGETARRRAITDELTSLYNRRFLEESIKERFGQGSVGLRKMTLMMMDLDKVHHINETHGTAAGDTVIIAVADTIRNLLRTGDISARLSGDEFAILLSDTDAPDAMHMGERIRQGVLSLSISVPVSPGASEFVEIGARTSIGVAVAPTHADNCDALLAVADEALRKAKELGRNRVELA